MKDKPLLEAWNSYVATNDMAALEVVYSALYDDTLYFAINKCEGTHFEAEDVVDEVWGKLAVRKPRIDSNIRSYILAMVNNAIIDLLRKSGKTVSEELTENIISEPMKLVFLDEEKAQQQDLAIRQCLNEKEYNFIMQLFDLIGNRYTIKKADEQLSETLNIALQTVRNKRTIITKKLKACRTNRSK